MRWIDYNLIVCGLSNGSVVICDVMYLLSRQINTNTNTDSNSNSNSNTNTNANTKYSNGYSNGNNSTDDEQYKLGTCIDKVSISAITQI